MNAAATTGEPPRLRAVDTADAMTWAAPHNLACEESILGGVILRNEVLDELRDLEVDDFFSQRNKIVFQAVRNLEARESPIDLATLENEIEMGGKLDSIGGVAYLGELALKVPTPDNVVAYAEEVRQHSTNRKAIVATASTLARMKTWPHQANELISECLGELQRIEAEQLRSQKRNRSVRISVKASLEELAALANAPVYPTPYEALNDAMGFGGFIGTQVYTVAAGTGRGKTSWVAAVAAHAAQSVPVLVATYEMKPGYFVARRAAGVLGVHSNAILRGKIDMAAVERTLPTDRLFLLNRPSLKTLRREVEYAVKDFGTPPLVIVDYLQKLADEIASRQQRPDLRMATSEASATLIDIAEKTGAAVVAVSSIGRGKGKLLSNPRKAAPYELVEVAKESGAVEYDGAGLIVLTLQEDISEDERQATMTLAKSRFGPECHIDARFMKRSGHWIALDRVSEIDKKTIKDVGEAANKKLEADLREAIFGALANGSKKTIADIAKACKKQKKVVSDELKLMVEDEVISYSPGEGYARKSAVLKGSENGTAQPELELGAE